MKAVLFSLLALALAGCSSGPKVAVQPSIEGKKLASGARIDALAVSDSLQMRSWSSAGAPLKEWVMPQVMRDLSEQPEGPKANPDRRRDIILRLTMPSAENEPTVVFREDGGEVLPGNTSLESGAWMDDGWSPATWSAWYSKSFRGRDVVDLSVGIATGPWQTIGRYHQTDGKFVHVSGSAFNPLVIPEPVPKGKAGETSLAIVMSMPSSPMARAFRLHVTDRKGQPMWGAGSINGKEGQPSEYWFRGRAQDVGTIELQSRSFEWEYVQDVRLDPGA